MAKIRPRGEKGGRAKHHNDDRDANPAEPAYDDRSSDASSDLVSESTASAEEEDDGPAGPRGQHRQLSIGAVSR